ncbi:MULTISPECIES: nickel ABC transporter permease [Planococcaceae]|uniref:Nickel import system permease protein NikB n=1 Tax=Planococcus halotolerans TaxID=2233542 RepID=A0A365L7I6_9BACL|nr:MULTISPECIES: nickel ABC transporter permease [Planococcaceae]RAZ81343.1 nickel ABC transporter permease subunit NikB [Planococcus halotolerans]RLQ89901.1 ABC transporter permease [Planomicrobium sp. Y74]
MFRILSRRLIEVAVFLLIITFVSFLFARLAPGDPVLSILRVDDVSVTNEQVEQLREEMGFNEPLLVQYGQWLTDFVKMDFGNSYITNQPVMEMLWSGLPATLELTAGALLVMLLIAVPLGSLAALYRDSWIDHVSRWVSLLGAAVPSFWLGLIMIDLFGVRFGILPTMGRDGIISAVLPSITLGLAITSVYVRLLRSSLIDSLGHEYIRAAQARGLSKSRIFFSHAFRSSLPPVITVFGVSLGSLIGGVVVIEVIFAYPGIGKMVVDAIRSRDYPVIQGYILIMAILIFIVNSAVDLSYRYLNPELRLKEKRGS